MSVLVGITPEKIAITALSFLFSWRLWRFTFRPRLYPDEPEELPYWIPFVGHAFSFFFDFNGTIEKGRRFFSESCEPFAMTVAGQTIYVATSAEDISGVWKNNKTISMNPITMDMYVLAGLSERTRKSLFEQDPTARYNLGQGRPLTPTQMTIELHHQQLHTGPRLDSLMKDKMLPSISRKLQMTELANKALIGGSKNSSIISLHDLCVDIFIREETEAYFGPTLLRNSPGLIASFLDWEYCSWKFLFMLPNVFAQDMVRAKESITGAFADYYRQPRNQRPGSIFFVDALESMLREVGLTEDEMGKFTLLHYWAVVGNLYKLTFWLVSHLAHSPELLEQIREEVLPSVHGNHVNETYLLDECPKLESLVSEILRLTVTSSLARVIVEPTIIGTKMLKPGNNIMLPIRELHYSTETWGSSPEIFKPSRFMDNTRLSKSTSYRPWGGGHTLCPGRFLAKRSANAFVAILITRYDIAIDSGDFPKGDGARPSPGVITIGRGQDLRIRLTKRG